MPSSICYLEIPAPDLAAAERFYSAVFGWTCQRMGPDYASFDDGESGGGFSPRMPATDGGVVIYLKVEDIPAALVRIAAAGGATVKERTEIGGDMGFYAWFRDPNGNRIGLWSKT